MPTTTDAGLVPASLAAVERPASDPRGSANIRVSFQPWGNRRVGDPDPGAPGYQVLDGEVYLSQRGAVTGRRCLFFEDVSGRRFVVADGESFRAEAADDLPAELIAAATLEDCGPIVGVQIEDGSAYIPAGCHAVVMPHD